MADNKRRSVRSIQQHLKINEGSIATRAYEKWLARGRPTGDGVEDWFAAQSELERETAKRPARTSKDASA